jgi:dimethylargininase
VAVCARDVAIVTRPGSPSRRGETEGLAEVLGRHFAEVSCVQAPGTLEGGDVMTVGDRCYVGLSARTSRAGVEQLGAVLARHGRSVVPVAMPELLHLKTGLSWLEDDTLLVGGDFLDHPTFRTWNRLEVPAEEAYAANSVRVNDRVLVPAGFPRTEAALRAAGFRTLAVDTSEFRKLDGGLSCLSLRW